MRKHGTVREEMGVDQGKKLDIKEVKEKEIREENLSIIEIEYDQILDFLSRVDARFPVKR